MFESRGVARNLQYNVISLDKKYMMLWQCREQEPNLVHDRRLPDEVMSQLSHEEQIKVIQEHVHLHSDPRIFSFSLNLWKDQREALKIPCCALSRIFGFGSLGSVALLNWECSSRVE